MYRVGLISPKVFAILPTIDKVDALMRAGKSKVQAVRHVAKEMGVTERTIYNYL